MLSRGMLAIRHLSRHHAQARVHVRVAAADFGRDGDFARELGKNLRALGVNRALEVLDLRPFAVTSHISI
jgi:hypothetical protein